ncbi:50S ribosomal protein L2 [Candidatus Woesearchaeota archaeon]|nr:50S ribosomal protein L2 [Candidatus Woesearchaeota archaeon]
MGKNLIQQARGKGGPTYRAPSFKYKAKVEYIFSAKSAEIVNFVKCRGHSAPLAYVKYDSGETGYLIAAEGLRVGDILTFESSASSIVGNTMRLEEIPIGTNIFNIESVPGDGGKFIRSSGTFGKVLAKMRNKVIVQLPSKKERSFDPKCRATIGVIAGSGRKEKPFLKAGRKYHYMKARNKLYPKVGGLAMNAVDHPYGTSRSSKKGHPTIARKNAPPGAKVGKLRPRRTGRRKK